MTETTLHRPPTLAAFFGEEVRVVGAAVGREAVLLVGGVFLMLAVVLVANLRYGESMSLDAFADIGTLPLMSTFGALFVPFAVWKGEPRFGTGPLWLLPVGHRRSALGKVAAGWVWTMAVTAILLILVLSVSIASGGAVGVERTLHLSPTIDPADVTPVQWGVHWWQWVTIFTGATIAYLAVSALLLATAHPFRWLIGVGGVLFLAAGMIDISNSPELAQRAAHALRTLMIGRFGVDAFMSGGIESFNRTVELPTGPRRIVSQLPTAGRWLAATSLWLGATLAALFAAASRHRGR
jgi:hypothetical protein